MSNEFNHEVRSTSEDGMTFVVRFMDKNDVFEALNRLMTIKFAYEHRFDIRRIREICQSEDNRVFFPLNDVNLPKARWVSVSAAASYPHGVPVDEISARTGLKSSEISAYCTSKNNPTSEYLHSDKGLIYFSAEGYNWLIGLLEKDKQIENKEMRS